MKILQVNKFYYPWIGGIETIVKQIAEGLNTIYNMKNDVLVCNSKNERIIEKINGIKIFKAKTLKIVLGMPISFDFFILFKKIVKNYDLIFIHYPFPLGFIAYFLFSRDKNLVIWYHSDIVRQKFLEIFFRPIHFYAFKKAKKIFVSNPNLIESSNYLSKFKEKCIVVPFGVDLEYFKEDEIIKKEAKKVKKEFGAPLILAVGRLSYYKGFEYLIQAAKNLKANILIIGEGKMKNKLLRMIEDFGLLKKVFIIPHVNDLRPYYLACDIFILPSIHRSEAFGIVILEAMSFGKPVISTELNTGTSWININNETGFVIKPRDCNEIIYAVNKILEDKNLYNFFSINCKKRVKDFSLKNFFDKLFFEVKNL